MNNNILFDWQNKETVINDISIDEVIEKSQKMSRQIKFRNIREYLACVFIVITFGIRAVHASTSFSMMMCWFMVASGIFIALMIYKKGTFEGGASPTLPASEYISKYREQLIKQISLLSKVRYWYVGPLMLGISGLQLEEMYLDYAVNGLDFRGLAILIGLLVLGLIIVYLNEVVAVGQLRKELARLE